MRIIEGVVPPKDDPEILTVVLKQSEVNALYAICGFVGGNPENTGRGAFDEFARQLEIYKSRNHRINGSIYFEN